MKRKVWTPSSETFGLRSYLAWLRTFLAWLTNFSGLAYELFWLGLRTFLAWLTNFSGLAYDVGLVAYLIWAKLIFSGEAFLS
jgi:hypothetical protein